MTLDVLTAWSSGIWRRAVLQFGTQAWEGPVFPTSHPYESTTICLHIPKDPNFKTLLSPSKCSIRKELGHHLSIGDPHQKLFLY